jgi:hypothetical protein
MREESIEIGGVRHACRVLENNIGEIAMPIPQNHKAQAKATSVVMTMWVDRKLLITTGKPASVRRDRMERSSS